MLKKMPKPVLSRLSYLFDHLTFLRDQGVMKVSSAELGKALGLTSATIRKDINFLGIAGVAGAKYTTEDLRALLSEQLGFEQSRNCCVVGLGRLGTAFMQHFAAYDQKEFRLVAGFESNINRLETIQSPIALYPGYRIEEVVRQLQIELAIITVPARNAQEVADRCCEGGVCGIINVTPAVIKPQGNNVFIRSVDISGELRVLSALLHTYSTESKTI